MKANHFSSFSYLVSVETFLLSPDEKEVLLIKRDMSKEVLPGYYGGAGGKMDPSFLETPLEAAWREVKEETGYLKKEIKNFRFLGTFTVSDRFGKWIVFEFTGRVTRKKYQTKKISEGILEWIPFTRLKKIKLIQDLKKTGLELLLKEKKPVWIRTVYDKKDGLKHFKRIR